jgi:plasmid stabilization system protein ParE
MRVRAEYHPRTASDLNSAVSHYNDLRQGLGDELRSEVYAAIDRILANPRQFAVVERDVRRCFVRRFPYSILFRLVDEGVVRILAIRHHRRHPRFGFGRL